MKYIKPISFICATAAFCFAVDIVWKNWNSPITSISSFAALEYCGLYVYTIYDYIKNYNDV